MYPVEVTAVTWESDAAKVVVRWLLVPGRGLRYRFAVEDPGGARTARTTEDE
jgi:hypothetical protein